MFSVPPDPNGSSPLNPRARVFQSFRLAHRIRLETSKTRSIVSFPTKLVESRPLLPADRKAEEKMDGNEMMVGWMDRYGSWVSWVEDASTVARGVEEGDGWRRARSSIDL